MRRLASVRLRVECLEDRTVPALLATGSFFHYDGVVAQAKKPDTVAFSLPASDFTLPSGAFYLRLIVEAAPGSTLNPDDIKLVRKTAVKRPHEIIDRNNISGSSASQVIFKVTPGQYAIEVRGKGKTKGAYTLNASLAGDVNGDFQVNNNDLVLLKSLKNVKRGKSNYSLAADVTGNGLINSLDGLIAKRNLGVATTAGLEDPLDEFLSSSALTLGNVDLNRFNPLSSDVTFNLAGASFFHDPADVHLKVNGSEVDASGFNVGEHQIVVSHPLQNGKNDLQFQAYDSVGRPLYYSATVWAGNNTLTVNLVDETNQPFSGTAVVKAELGDDETINSLITTSTGQAIFANLPQRTILVSAISSAGEFGAIGILGSDGSVTIKLIGLGTSSTIDNNDISAGTAGWDIGSAPVDVVPHEEGIPGTGQAIIVAGASTGHRDQQVTTSAGLSLTSSATLVGNQDLVVNTSGIGEQSISRTFETKPGTKTVTVRYRFITSEVPGGYFGSEFNDFYRISIQTSSGAPVTELKTMNGLGLGAFDFASGATAWKELKLNVNGDGDTVRVTAGVANVGDGAYQSQVVVDFVAEKPSQIAPTLAWNTTQGGLKLTYQVKGEDVTEATPIKVYWASGTTYSSILSNTPLFTYTVPAGTKQGATTYGPFNIAGSLLNNAPTGTKYLLASSSETEVMALADVQIGFGGNANAGTVKAATIATLKELLRRSGQSSVTITSTARTPADQARAMFNNLTNPAFSLATNIANQLAIYAAAGDSVIGVFSSMVQGQTLQQVLANKTAIKAAMEQMIIAVGPSSVSKHCADSTTLAVVDIATSSFTASTLSRFKTAAISDNRVSKFINEVSTNGCYHLELPQ